MSAAAAPIRDAKNYCVTLIRLSDKDGVKHRFEIDGTQSQSEQMRQVEELCVRQWQNLRDDQDFILRQVTKAHPHELDLNERRKIVADEAVSVCQFFQARCA